MKKLSLITLLIVTTFISCSKDDDATPTNQELIIGKWQLTEITDSQGSETLNVCDLMDSYEFKSDKTAIYIEHGGETAESCIPYESKETWSISKNILTAKYDKTTEDATILELNETMLKLKYEEEGDISTFTYKKV
ncbi:lipocalin family protein [Aquimarina sp. MAR_2010_214]|uniref:lipocalin family protein n=1 Tax=Aquimarina sp. MAR_2010_214 TaxID=1250026 RepID=UPI001304515E|nr:lipocalin family protein [Aquimarina sp. MAR_2010_214]